MFNADVNDHNVNNDDYDENEGDYDVNDGDYDVNDDDYVVNNDYYDVNDDDYIVNDDDYDDNDEGNLHFSGTEECVRSVPSQRPPCFVGHILIIIRHELESWWWLVIKTIRIRKMKMILFLKDD